MFFGREKELETLKGFLGKKVSSFVVLKGRRRVGKSTLIREFAKGMCFISLAGIPPNGSTTKQSQIDVFGHALNRVLNLPNVQYNNWEDAFHMLADHTKKGRVIILLDEISWMGSKDPDFLGKLKSAWDEKFKLNSRLILVVCGSISSWIEDNILNSTGFMGRISHTMTLSELPVQDCSKFWESSGASISSYEKFKVLSVTGGIPRYLEEVNTNQTAEENIRNLGFKRGGVFREEFEHIFNDLFSSRSRIYKEIVKVLVEGALEYKQLAEKIGRESTGRLSSYLADLTQAGFISRDFTWHLKNNKTSKLSHYRLSDNYVRFYLKYIEPIKEKIDQGMAEGEFDSINWHSIIGLQFENLVLNNRQFICDNLGLKFSDIVANNPYFQRKSSSNEGCQIDYLIQTKFNNLFACEVKFSGRPLGMEVVDEMKKKLERLRKPKGFSCWPVLVHVNGVTDYVEQCGYFSKIIDFGQSLD